MNVTCFYCIVVTSLVAPDVSASQLGRVTITAWTKRISGNDVAGPPSEGNVTYQPVAILYDKSHLASTPEEAGKSTRANSSIASLENQKTKMPDISLSSLMNHYGADNGGSAIFSFRHKKKIRKDSADLVIMEVIGYQ